MLIGKYWDESDDHYYWAEGDNLEDLIISLEQELADINYRHDLNPEKIVVWEAIPKKIRATYTIE